MTDTISPIASASKVAAELPKTDAQQSNPAKASQPAAVDTAQQRLVIEPVSSHRYVYKVMDTSTGEVLRQLPTEAVEKMIADPAYTRGGLVNTSA